MIVLGLTGSIGMGKSWASQAFRHFGVPVFDADAASHNLTRDGSPVLEKIEAAFPGVVSGGVLDREALAARAFDNDRSLGILESLLHPLVQMRERRFLDLHARRRSPLVVLAIPLLFETGAEARCDWVAVVSAPGFLQRRRVLSRPGMTRTRLDEILAQQMPDPEKCRRADFIIPTGLDRGFSLRQVRDIVTVAKTPDEGVA